MQPTEESHQENILEISAVEVEYSNASNQKGTITPSNSSDEDEDGNTKPKNDYKDYERDPFFAFVPQLARWGCGLLANEGRIVQKGVLSAPGFTKDFLADTYRYYRENPRILYKEIVSGFTVAIMQVPESIAFSFVAGVPPLSGLQATWWMAFITGILGGKPGMISGAAGALAVVVTKLTASDGVLSYLTVEERLNVLYMTMFVCGLFQIGFAVFRLAKLVRLIPETGMIGFMNGECYDRLCPGSHPLVRPSRGAVIPSAVVVCGFCNRSVFLPFHSVLFHSNSIVFLSTQRISEWTTNRSIY